MNAMEGRSAGTAADSNVAWVHPEPRGAESLASLARLFLASSLPVYVCDPAGALILRNRAFDDIAIAVYGADKSRPEDTPPRLMHLIERLYASRAPIEETHTVNGRTLRVRHVPLIDDRGGINGFSGSWSDITAVVEANRRAARTESWLLDVIRSSSDWVWSTDARLNLTFASPRIAETVGRPPQVLVGHYLLALGQFEPTDGIPDAMGLIARRAPFRNAVFQMTHGKSELRRVQLSGVPIFDDETGAFAGYRGTGTDVTRRHAAEQDAFASRVKLEEAVEELKSRNAQLDLALEQAQAADKAKTDFLAMMSHELRTPLNSIIGFSDAAQAKLFGPLHESYLGYFRNIHRAGKHLLALIEDLLDTANIKRQTLSIKVAPVRAQDLIAEARALVVLRAADKKVDITACDLTGPWIVLADRVRARQIFANLLSNAIKFTASGGRVGVEAQVEGDRLAITVWDTGIGIPAAEAERVFERFYQGENNILTRQTEGMGLGLAVARELARLMDGDITLQSLPGRGARFTVTLPLARALSGSDEP
ncbi:MAG: ATP-binding protein [Gemmatimonas sp.]